MIRIRPFSRDAPNTAWWPDGHKPEYCASPCRRSCRATQAINIWHMVWTYIANRDVPFTGHGHPDTHVFVQSIDFYMDQYGCVAIGPKGSEAQTIAQGVGFIGYTEPEVGKLWQFARTRILGENVEYKAPGTVQLLPSIESIVLRLHLAADYGA